MAHNFYVPNSNTPTMGCYPNLPPHLRNDPAIAPAHINHGRPSNRDNMPLRKPERRYDARTDKEPPLEAILAFKRRQEYIENLRQERLHQRTCKCSKKQPKPEKSSHIDIDVLAILAILAIHPELYALTTGPEAGIIATLGLAHLNMSEDDPKYKALLSEQTELFREAKEGVDEDMEEGEDGKCRCQ